MRLAVAVSGSLRAPDAAAQNGLRSPLRAGSVSAAPVTEPG